MPHDPVLIEDVRAWMGKARNDLRAADLDLNADPPLIEDTLFHCQQAVEKSLKAFLVFHDQYIRKTHNLEELGEACLKIDNTMLYLVDRAVPLTEYATVFRYPGISTIPKRAEVDEAVQIAGDVFKEVCRRLPAQCTAF